MKPHPNPPFHDADVVRTRVFIETYGCQMNIADSLLIRGILGKAGYVVTPRADQADVIIINTCAVREHAEARVLGRLGQLRREKARRPHLLIGVCGCMAKHLKEGLIEKAPWVDFLAGPDAYRELPALIHRAAHAGPSIDLRFRRQETYEGTAPSAIDGITGYLPVQRGCDRFCTFCIVPFVRGRERSSSPQQILREAQALAEAGAREIILLGQRVNAYRYEGTDLADLLRMLVADERILRWGFTSPYPLDFSDKLIAVLAEHPRILRYLHLPLQSGSDAVLERMNRGYTTREYRELVAALRKAIPSIALSTDLIVGFPGETEGEFQATLDMVSELRFDSAFMFHYSERPGTSASRHLADDVPRELKIARLQRLIAVQEASSHEANAAYLGRTVQVLVSGRSRRDAATWSGKTETFKTTVFTAPDTEGDLDGLVEVKVLRHTSHTLIGTKIDAAEKKVRC